MTTEQIQQQLQAFEPYLELTHFIKDGIRLMVWLLLRGVIWLADQVSGIFTEVFKIFDILKNPQITQLVKDLTPIAWGVGAVCLAYFGIRLIFFPGTKVAKGFQNFLIGVFVVATSTIAIPYLVESTANITTVLNGQEQASTVYQIVSQNMTDLYALDEAGTGEADTARATVTKETIGYLNIIESIDTNNLKNYKEVFSKKLTLLPTGQVQVTGFNKLLWIKETESYYRFRYSFWNIVIGLGILIAVYIMTSIKVTKLLFEMVYSYTILNVFALTDIENGEKLKKVIKNIVNVLITIILSSYMIYLFGIVYPLVGNLELNPIAKMVAQFGLALAVIDGPVIIQELTGYDAGLKSTTLGAFGMLQGLSMVGKTAGKIGAGAVSGVKKGASKVSNLMREDTPSKGADFEKSVDGKVSEKQGEASGASSTGTSSAEGGTPSNKGKEFAEQMAKNQEKYGVSQPEIHSSKANSQPVVAQRKANPEQARKMKEAENRIRQNHGVGNHAGRAIVTQNGSSSPTKPSFPSVTLPPEIEQHAGRKLLEEQLKPSKNSSS